MSKSAMPMTIEASNLSLGWAKVIKELARPGGGSISPLTLSLTGFDEDGYPFETQTIRHAIDEMLASLGKRDCDNVAFTIFPERYYQLAEGDRAEFFAMYKEAFPRIQTFNPRNNKRGSYFQRLIDFEGGGAGFNQLDWILTEYHRNPKTRASKWQATTFDPYRDFSTTAQQEFPCLQQVSFTFSDDGGLILNAFYATQQIIRKAYGNYLGLSRLGRFMAKEMGVRMERLNVFIGIAKADEMKKSDPAFQTLISVIDAELVAQEMPKVA